MKIVNMKRSDKVYDISLNLKSDAQKIHNLISQSKTISNAINQLKEKEGSEPLHSNMETDNVQLYVVQNNSVAIILSATFENIDGKWILVDESTVNLRITIYNKYFEIDQEIAAILMSLSMADKIGG